MKSADAKENSNMNQHSLIQVATDVHYIVWQKTVFFQTDCADLDSYHCMFARIQQSASIRFISKVHRICSTIGSRKHSP
jgi:hypothetical protein